MLQLVQILALIATFIPDYTLAGTTSNLVQPNTVIINQTIVVDEVTKTADDYIQSPPVSAKAFLRKMRLFPFEMREAIMSKSWKASALSVLPIEMLPLLTSVRHVVVDNVHSFAAVFNAFQKLKTIDLKPLDWYRNGKGDMLLMVKMLANIAKRQTQSPIVTNLNYMFVVARTNAEYKVMRVLLSTLPLSSQLHPNMLADAIRHASEVGNDKLVELLLTDNRTNPTSFDNEAIRFSSENGHDKVVKLLLADSRVDPSADNNYAIRMAVVNGHEEVVQLLLNHRRVNPAANDNFAIRSASQQRNTNVLQLLLKDGRADPTADGNFAIIFVSQNGHADAIQMLLEEGRADPTAQGNYAIRVASQHGYDKVVELLLKDGRADPTAQGNYAIRVALENGHDNVAKLLRADRRVNRTLRKKFACAIL